MMITWVMTGHIGLLSFTKNFDLTKLYFYDITLSVSVYVSFIPIEF
jgi:hypothetical protein